MISYYTSRPVNGNQFITLPEKNGFSTCCPLARRARIDAILVRAGLPITARDDEAVASVARTFVGYCYYFSDLAVSEVCQRHNDSESLLGAPTIIFQHIGFSQHPGAWTKKS